MYRSTIGIAFVSFKWVFVLIQLLTVTLRVYSRTFLTRSVGSDDLFLVMGFVRVAYPPSSATND